MNGMMSMAGIEVIKLGTGGADQLMNGKYDGWHIPDREWSNWQLPDHEWYGWHLSGHE